MVVLTCATPGYPARIPRVSRAIVTIRSSSQVFVPKTTTNTTQNLHDHPFVPEVEKAVDSLYTEFRAIDNLVARNTSRVLKAYQNARVGSHHFGGCTGYGHEEAGGREALDQAFAEIFGAESAIVRSQFFSGTHAITCALFAFLRPGDELLAVAGSPYDTLEEVIGIRDSHGLGSLKDFGVQYREVPLAEDGGLDWDALKGALRAETKCALIQRSCGYSWRRSLSVNEIGRAIKTIKMQNPNCLVMVDNCYGEFVENIEPPMVGADLIAGSLIKNPGGTIAPCGGYVAGRTKWVKAAAARLSAPGLGVDCGSTPGDIIRTFFQGLFLSPQMVGEAVKGGYLVAEVMATKGYKVQPLPRVPRHDTVQAVQLGSRERLLAFCEAVQRSSPVSSFTKPVAGSTPGYASEFYQDYTILSKPPKIVLCNIGISDSSRFFTFELPAVFWWYKTTSHAAELTAGYYNPTNQDGYSSVFEVLKKHSVTLKFICSGLHGSYREIDEALADPEGLSWQVLNSAWDRGLTVAGQNALPFYDREDCMRIVENAKPRNDPDGRQFAFFVYQQSLPLVQRTICFSELDYFFKCLHGETTGVLES